jgi:hypothetical protein
VPSPLSPRAVGWRRVLLGAQGCCEAGLVHGGRFSAMRPTRSGLPKSEAKDWPI